MRKFLQSLKKHYYICYTLIFAVLCVFIFSFFWYNGKSFIWSGDTGDGLYQHYTAYIYYGRYLRSIVNSIFVDHTFSIPTFSMSIGYGSDILTTLSYYVIGDPICALTVFVPTRYMAYFYDFSILLRFYLSGLTFSKLCFYVNQKRDVKYSKTAIMIGTFIYTFCGYALFAGVRHPYFLNPMIYFPLVLLGVEMILDKKRPYEFIVAVFLSAISNLYFFYMIVIMTILYVIWRLVFVYHKSEIKEAFVSLGKIAIYSILGTAMSAAVLIPTLLVFLGDARNESEYVYSNLYTLSDYQKNISGFIAVDTHHDWVYLGYAAVALLAVFLLFMKKKEYTNIKVAFIGMAIMLSIPAAGKIVTGNTYVNNRWVWAFGLLVGYIVVLMWDKLLTACFREKIYLVICLCVYFVLCMLMTKSRTVDYFIPLVLAFICLCLLLCQTKDYHGIIKGAIVFCVFANIGINALFMYSPRFDDYVSEFVDTRNIVNNYKNTEVNALNELTDDENDTFSRYTGEITLNRTLYTGLHSTQYYWSLSNSNITAFQKETGLNYFEPEQYTDLDSRASFTTLANVRYYVGKSGDEDAVPYEFKSIGTNSGYEVYENENDLPFGYTYANYITRETYDNLTPIQKQEAMLQAVVLEDDEKDDEITPAITSEIIKYTVEDTDGVQWEDNQIEVKKTNGSVTLSFYGMENSENYIYIQGLNYKGISPRERYTDDEWASKSIYEKNEINYEGKFWTESTKVTLKFSSENINEETSSTSIEYMTPYFKWYSNQHDYLVNLYYDELPRQSITISFPTTGVYTYDDIEILCQPMDSYSEQVDALKTDTLDHVDFHDDNSAYATNEITGEIDLDQGKFLLLTIPYSSGWTAYVDGEEQELLQANTMYMALKLDAGEHSIELKYHTPGLTVGVCISLVAFAVFILILAFLERRDKMVTNKDRENLIEGDKQ